MNRTIRYFSLLLAPALLAWTVLAALPAVAQSATNGATAELKDAQGATIGNATLTTTGSGAVKIQVSVNGFTAAAVGDHGIHIHAVGKCEGPAFTTAGGHFNPTTKKHGLNNPEGPHGGDLPNLVMSAGGSATYEATDDRISLENGAANSIFDADGSAVVIHAGPDDLMTDPAGNSGARVACGVLSAALIPVGMPSTGGMSQDVYIWLAVGVVLLAGGLLATRVKRPGSTQ